MKQLILAALITATTLAAHALTIRPYEGSKSRPVPAIFTTQKPTEVNTAEAMMKALNGAPVWKCQLQEAAASKNGIGMKAKRGG